MIMIIQQNQEVRIVRWTFKRGLFVCAYVWTTVFTKSERSQLADNDLLKSSNNNYIVNVTLLSFEGVKLNTSCKFNVFNIII